MAAPTRSAMRMLSRRLQMPRPVTTVPHQIRSVSSRYSNPTKRTTSAAEVPPSSFIGGPKSEAASADATTPGSANHGSNDALVLEHRRLVDMHRAWHEQRQKDFAQMRLLGMGLLCTIAATGLVVYNIDLDQLEKEAAEKRRRKEAGATAANGSHKMDASDEANEKFQGREVHVIGAGDGKRIVAQGPSGMDIELVETGTSSVPHFPRTIFLPTSPESTASTGLAPNAPGNPGNVDNQEEYTLVGLGIRTVMWIQVYVVGLYIRTKDISTLQSKLIHHVNPIASTLVPAEKETLKQKLLDPSESREIWSELLEVPGLKTAWRVSPTRNTDFGHLRDGFVTGINKRTQEAKQRDPQPAGESEYDTEEFGRSVQQFKGVFAGGKAPKGSLLIMLRDTNGSMDVLYHAKPDGKGAENQIEKLGSVADERISRLIWLGYLGGDKVSSEAARKGVVDGCVSFASRPVGSVETMVT